MTAEAENALQALYDEWRHTVGDHKMVHKPVTMMRQDDRELFVGWLLETITPQLLEEFLGKKFEEPTEPPKDPQPS